MVMASALLRALMVFAAAGGLAIAQNYPAQPAPPAPSAPPAQPTPSALPAPIMTITITAQEYHFTPSTIKLQAGRPVRLILENHGTVNHEFVSPIFKNSKDVAIRSQGIKVEGDDIGEVEFGKGKVVTIDLTPSKTGTLQFWCGEQAGGGKLHRDLGMRGTLSVTK
jgi:uncharacterized cupredoxin-like copper-binding protein